MNSEKVYPVNGTGTEHRVNLFVIGVYKAGSSWLHDLLGAHPDIFMVKEKELYFFGRDYPHGLDRYHSHFDFSRDFRYFGESTQTYYCDPGVPDQIKEYSPKAKIVVIVRDPVQRVLSQFFFQKQIGEISESYKLEDIIMEKDSRFLDYSRYEQTLPLYEERFSRENFKIISLEQSTDSPEQTWNELIDFLGLDRHDYRHFFNGAKNITGAKGFRFIYRNTIRKIKLNSPVFYQFLLRRRLMKWSKTLLLRTFGKAEKDALSDDLYRQLREEFAPTYEYLCDAGFDMYSKKASTG